MLCSTSSTAGLVTSTGLASGAARGAGASTERTATAAGAASWTTVLIQTSWQFLEFNIVEIAEIVKLGHDRWWSSVVPLLW